MTRDENLCPKCESKMKPAKSKFGMYWRCTRWGCDGTRDVMGRSKQEKDEEYEREDE